MVPHNAKLAFTNSNRCNAHPVYADRSRSGADCRSRCDSMHHVKPRESFTNVLRCIAICHMKVLYEQS